VKITEEEAENYHMAQIKTFSESDADLVSAFTITHIEEAIGLCRAAKTAEIPIVISFTVETDGKLPNGLSLQDAVQRVDKSTDSLPAYYMINCAHPTHFDHSLNSGQSWEQRIHGIRANASKKSHAELDESETLDDGNPAELGDQFKEFIIRHHSIHILGGCCGTDHRHIEEIAKSCTS
jgi:S-methylmethionine-dependent homocysteine/selenocysteine methylase